MKVNTLEIGLTMAIVALLGVTVVSCRNAAEDLRRLSCKDNLQYLEGATATWWHDAHTHWEIPPENVLFGDGKYIPKKPICPSGGFYTPTTSGLWYCSLEKTLRHTNIPAYATLRTSR